jgi:toxin ParE1/3/4
VKVVWSALAEKRTAEAYTYIASDRPTAAARWLDRLIASVGMLAEFPDRGRVVPELQRSDIREIIVAPYRVAYRRDPKRVIVLTVRHGRRQFDADEVAR